MDHGGGEGHGGMDHGGHGGMDHGGMDMSCPMSMTWNWDTRNLCILSSSWRVDSLSSLYFSLTLIVLVGMFYEWLRLYIRRLDVRIARSVGSGSNSQHHHRRRASILPTSLSSSSSSSDPILGGADRRSSGHSPTPSILSNFKKGKLPIRKRTQVYRSTLYAVTVLIAFLLMLVAMTFNAWIIGAIVLGSGLGHYVFNRDIASLLADEDKGLACHL